MQIKIFLGSKIMMLFIQQKIKIAFINLESLNIQVLLHLHLQ